MTIRVPELPFDQERFDELLGAAIIGVDLNRSNYHWKKITAFAMQPDQQSDIHYKGLEYSWEPDNSLIYMGKNPPEFVRSIDRFRIGGGFSCITRFAIPEDCIVFAYQSNGLITIRWCVSPEKDNQVGMIMAHRWCTNEAVSSEVRQAARNEICNQLLQQRLRCTRQEAAQVVQAADNSDERVFAALQWLFRCRSMRFQTKEEHSQHISRQAFADYMLILLTGILGLDKNEPYTPGRERILQVFINESLPQPEHRGTTGKMKRFLATALAILALASLHDIEIMEG